MRKVTLMIIAILVSSIAIAQWEMIYPNTNFDYIGKVFFVDENHGWFPADSGKIYHTQDGGDNWALQFSDPSYSIEHICFANLNTGWASGGDSVLLKSTDGGVTWNSVTAYPGSTVQAIQTFGNDSCWVVGGWGLEDGKIYFSSDGGTSWQTQYSGDLKLFSMSFVDNLVGLAVGWGGTIIKTSNGGISWDHIPYLNENWLHKVCFTDANTGYILQYGGFSERVILKTIDGGISWDSIYTDNWIFDLSFQNADTGFYVISYAGSSNAYVFGTFDGGTSWHERVVPFGNSTTIFNDFGKVWVPSGSNPSHLFKSDDFGESWIHSYPTQPTFKDLNAVDFCTDLEGYAVGENGTILRTSDGGDSWSLHEQVTSYSLKDIQFVGEFIGWIVGENGTILKTEDAGTTWNEQSNPIEEDFFDASFVNENTGWVISYNTLLGTVNGGTDWELVNLPFSYTLKAVCFTSMDEGWLIGSSNLYHTSDGGMNWELSQEFFWPFEIGPTWITFTDSENGFIAGSHGSFSGGYGSFLYKTDNGGESWLDISEGVDGVIHAFSFYDANHGLSANSFDWGEVIIPETIDGGSTWEVSSDLLNHFGNSLYPKDISFINSSTAILVGSQGLIMKWSDPITSVPITASGSKPEVNIYPNPTRNKISINKGKGTEITILSSSGIPIIREGIPENTYTVDLRTLPPGIYFCKVLLGEQVITRKIIKL